jgi:hypothetical protein
VLLVQLSVSVNALDSDERPAKMTYGLPEESNSARPPAVPSTRACPQEVGMVKLAI